VVDPYAIVDEFGADAFRYFLLREVPFGQDGDFSRDAMIGRINSDLANGLGNLLSRTLTLIDRFAEGEIPPIPPPLETPMEEELTEPGLAIFRQGDSDIKELAFGRSLEEIWRLAKACDQYIEKNAPWILAKDQSKREQLHRVLYRAADALRLLTIAVYPFMPSTAQAMQRQLGLNLDFSKPIPFTDRQWNKLLPGTMIEKGSALFPRIDPSHKQGAAPVSTEQSTSPTPPSSPTTTTAPAASPQPAPAAPATDQITIDEFQKIQLKTALVLSAERVPKSEKLIKLQVDLGSEQRQIVAGIGKKYEPEHLIGKRIVIVANLKPAKLMGIESQGMVLAAGDKDVGGLVTVIEDVPPGTKVK
jgi:methionyl-tRNA synthetase